MATLHAWFFMLVRRFRWLCLAVVLVLSGIAAAVLLKTDFSTDMLNLLPADSSARQKLDIVIQSGILNKATIYFSKKDDSPFTENELDGFLPQTMADLKNLPGVNGVNGSIREHSLNKLLLDYSRFYPQFISPEEAFPAADLLRKKMSATYTQMVMNPFYNTDQFAIDPLGWNRKTMLNLEKMLSLSGFRNNRESKYILSVDRRNCMVMLSTTVSAAEYNGCKKLVDGIEKIFAALPDKVKGDLCASHLNTVVNGDVMQEDMKLLTIASVIIFALLFALIYRWDWRGLAIPVTVGIAGGIGLAVTGMVSSEPLSVFTAAFGGILIGIGGDYGIHLYTASFSGRRLRRGIELVPGLFFAFLTTASALACFMFSGVPVFVQFGVFAFLTLGIAFLLFILLMPGFFFREGGRDKSLDFYGWTKKYAGRWDKGKYLLLVAVIALAVFGVCRMKFDLDIRKFDIHGAMNLEKERYYQQQFTSLNVPLLLLYQAPDADEVLEKMDRGISALRKEFPQMAVVAASDIFVPGKVRQQNLEKWKDFIKSGGFAVKKQQIVKIAGETGFENTLLLPFFDRLQQAVEIPSAGEPLMLQLAGQIMYNSQISAKGNYTAVAMVEAGVPEKDVQRCSGGVVISKDGLSGEIFHDLTDGFILLLPFMILMIPVMVMIYLRSVSKTLLAMLPVLFALLIIAGVHGLTGHKVSLAAAVASVVIIGISVDYGLLLLSGKQTGDIFNTVTFSALTTAAGGATVLFSRHPMLYMAGVTIITGILAAWLMSLLLLDISQKLSRRKMVNILFVAGVLIFANGCFSYNPFKDDGIEAVPAGVKCADRADFQGEFSGSMVFDYRFDRLTFLFAGKCAGEILSVYAMNAGGFPLFELHGKRTVLQKSVWHKPFLSKEREKTVSEFVYEALSFALLAPAESLPGVCKKQRGKNGEVIECREYPDGAFEKRVFGGREGRVYRHTYKNSAAGQRHEIRFYYNVPEHDFGCIYSGKRSFLQAAVKMKLMADEKEKNEN